MNTLIKMYCTELLKEAQEENLIVCSIDARSHNFILYSTCCAFSLQKLSNPKLLASPLIAPISSVEVLAQ